MSPRSLILLGFAALVACADGGADTGAVPVGPIDRDGDGFTADVDCDDANPSIQPLADELCNGVDDDCDGEVDGPESVDARIWYPDGDGDGYGDEALGERTCLRPAGWVDVGGDCNDADPAFRPDAAEADCTDPNDYDCDGLTVFEDGDGDGAAACVDCDDADPEAYPGALWFQDSDGDGFGVPIQAVSCLRPEGYSPTSDDCDDADPERHPDTQWFTDADGDGYGVRPPMATSCEPLDGLAPNADDCDDGQEVLSPETVWFRDADGDGFGDDATTQVQCVAQFGWTIQPGDCDDGARAINPLRRWYRDADGDGYGEASRWVESCLQPMGYVRDDNDCDDGDAAVRPGVAWYADADGDGFGNRNLRTSSCGPPVGFVSDDADCDDSDATVYPGADEVCDDIDHDCDGDDGLADCADCEALLDADPARTSGVYTIDPDGTGGDSPFDVYCDMTRDGGGWTRFWWYDPNDGFKAVKDVLGSSLSGCDPSAATRCFAPMPVAAADELLVVDDGSSWAAWTFDGTNTTAKKVHDTLTTALPSALACGDVWGPDVQSGAMTGNPFACDESNQDLAGCACFQYASIGGIWSFALDDDGDFDETAFAAGGDGRGGTGVDALETSRRGNTPTRGLELYWR